MTRALRYRSLVLDVDSTLCGVEGIDWLAARRGPEIARRVRELTDRAMNGEIALDEVFGQRLAMIQPTRAEIEALAQEYVARIAPGAREVILEARTAGVRIVLVSGGLRPAIRPLADDLEVELHAVDLRFGPEGGYVGFEESSALATQSGKLQVVSALGLRRPALAMGDGSTDVAMRAAVEAFAAYTGFVTRDAVVREADFVVSGFPALRSYLFTGS